MAPLLRWGGGLFGYGWLPPAAAAIEAMGPRQCLLRESAPLAGDTMGGGARGRRAALENRQGRGYDGCSASLVPFGGASASCREWVRRGAGSHGIDQAPGGCAAGERCVYRRAGRLQPGRSEGLCGSAGPAAGSVNKEVRAGPNPFPTRCPNFRSLAFPGVSVTVALRYLPELSALSCQVSSS